LFLLAQEARAARDTLAGELAGARSRITTLEAQAEEARGLANTMTERCQRLEEVCASTQLHTLAVGRVLRTWSSS
jgi:uncharacterized protein involved in exopolysaccharide biosynthesis